MGTMKKSSIAAGLFLSFLALGGTLGFVYPVVSELYYSRQMSRDLSDYHAIVQLKPPPLPPFEERPDLLIVCLGGSSTAWPDSSGIDWPSRIETRLGEVFPEQSVRVLNQGKEWFTSLHSLINFSTNLQQLKPDLVVVTHAINDLLLNADFSIFSNGPFRHDYGHFLGPVRDLVHRKTLHERVLERLGFRDEEYAAPEIVSSQFPGLRSFEANLINLYRLSGLPPERFILLSQPTLYKAEITDQEMQTLYMLNHEAVGNGKRWDFETALRGMNRYNEKTEQISDALGVHFLDLESVVPKTLEYFKDDVHYQDKAFPLIAKAVSQSIQESLSLSVAEKSR